MRVRLTQLDGSMSNLALMKLAHWHKSRGNEVVLTTEIYRGLFESDYEKVYGSAIFKFSQDRLLRFQREWPNALVGGTGTLYPWTVEEIIGGQYEEYDYTGYPEVDYSIGFTQRGCRSKCKFCVVPGKEGKPQSVNTIASIYRGAAWPKKLHLLDNDFFGNPQWRDRVAEIREGDVLQASGYAQSLFDPAQQAWLMERGINQLENALRTVIGNSTKNRVICLPHACAQLMAHSNMSLTPLEVTLRLRLQ